MIEHEFDSGWVDVARSLALWCPDWPVVAAGSDPAEHAVVVADGRVQACTAAAREHGVRRGQRLRDAQRLCPDAVVHAADEGAQAGLFEQVVTAVEQVAPRIEVIRPGLLALPSRGAARYHGGERALGEKVRDAVIASGFTGVVGIADGSFGAVLAAKSAWDIALDGSGDGLLVIEEGSTASFLAPHSVTVLDRPELAGVLLRLGIRTVGDLAALPAGDVLVRFGADGVAAHRLARGLLARPPAAQSPAEDLAVEWELDPPLSSADRVVFAAKAAADQLHENLGARGVVCVRVEVEVGTVSGASWTRLWRHDGQLSSTAVAERVRWQLDGWRTEAERGAALRGARRVPDPDPVSVLRLTPDDVVTDTGTQLSLWGQAQRNDAIERAATRLQAMLGHAGVETAVLTGGRGPGERVQRVPWGDVAEPAQSVEGSWPGRLPVPLPTAVPVPYEVGVFDADGRSVRVTARGEVTAAPAVLVEPGGPGGTSSFTVTGWTGPWPSVERWWDHAVARRLARMQLSTDDGRGWLVLVENGQWMVEGAYV